MCGAFSIILTPLGWKEVFSVEPPRSFSPVYNARPGEWLPIITEEHPDKITDALWNFLPHWMKNPSGRGVINARAETVATKPYFRASFKSKRCIVPADGFYEWERKSKLKIPYRFLQKKKQPFAFAGLYDELPDTSGNLGFAIITTDANELVAKIHERMPVLLDRPDQKQWLNQNFKSEALQALLRPYPAERMTMYPVSQAVNYSKNKSSSVIEPATR